MWWLVSGTWIIVLLDNPPTSNNWWCLWFTITFSFGSERNITNTKLVFNQKSFLTAANPNNIMSWDRAVPIPLAKNRASTEQRGQPVYRGWHLSIQVSNPLSKLIYSGSYRESKACSLDIRVGTGAFICGSSSRRHAQKFSMIYT